MPTSQKCMHAFACTHARTHTHTHTHARETRARAHTHTRAHVHRYILVGFLLYDGYVEHDRRLLEASQKLRAEGRISEAIATCEQALKVNPRRQEAWNNLGVMQRDAGRYGEATASLKAALDIDDRYVEGWTNLGVCQALSGDGAAAVKTGMSAGGRV